MCTGVYDQVEPHRVSCACETPADHNKTQLCRVNCTAYRNVDMPSKTGTATQHKKQVLLAQVIIHENS